MAVIRQQDPIDSVADALQYISYYHPMDFIEAMGEAYAAEEAPAAKDAIAQILTNSRMCAEGHRPIRRSRNLPEFAARKAFTGAVPLKIAERNSARALFRFLRFF